MCTKQGGNNRITKAVKTKAAYENQDGKGTEEQDLITRSSFDSCAVQSGSHEPRVAPEHLQCG